MLNESVYRSPKWLKKFFDLELHTGEDIKGKVSKREIREAERIKKEKLDKEWEDKWNQIFGKNLDNYDNRRKFENYLNESHPDIFKRFGRLRWHDDYKEFKKFSQGDFKYFSEFDAYIKKEKENEERQKRIKEELDNLTKRIIDDFVKNPYQDKVETPTIGHVKYRFENGDLIEYYSNNLIVINKDGKVTYTLGLFIQVQFSTIFNKIVERINNERKQRPGGNRKWEKPGQESTGDPSRDRYNKLVDKIKLREEQLNKMKPSDSEYNTLKNELDNYRRIAEKMRKEHKFEHLMIFNDFLFFNS